MKKYSRILAVCLALSLLAAWGAPGRAGTHGRAGPQTPAAASPSQGAHPLVLTSRIEVRSSCCPPSREL